MTEPCDVLGRQRVRAARKRRDRRSDARATVVFGVDPQAIVAGRFWALSWRYQNLSKATFLPRQGRRPVDIDPVRGTTNAAGGQGAIGVPT